MNLNFGDKILMTEDLQEMLENNNYSEIHYYAKDISGTNSYWYRENEEIKGTVNQVGLTKTF